MVLALVGVVIGGVIALLGQITMERLKERTEKRKKNEKTKAAVRVIRFHFFAAEHVLKLSLEAGCWWSREEGLSVAAAGEALDTLAELLTEEQWRIYSGAWRRLRGCIQRCDASVRMHASAMEDTEPTHGHNLTSIQIEPADLKFLLGAFVTVDQARHALQKYVTDSSTQKVELGRLHLTQQQIYEAIDEEAGRFVDRDYWKRILESCDGGQADSAPAVSPLTLPGTSPSEAPRAPAPR